MQAGTGIAEIIALEISRQGKHTLEEARKKIYLVDSKVIGCCRFFFSLNNFFVGFEECFSLPSGFWSFFCLNFIYVILPLVYLFHCLCVWGVGAGIGDKVPL
jgi:hypothetical protein